MHSCNLATKRASLLAVAVALAFPLAATAQYKVIGADGKISYSDRPPENAAAKVRDIDVAAASPGATALASLPLELRQVVARYPVTLYAAAACESCIAGRQLLRQRGIPHTEKVVKDGDGEALQKATGSRQIPVLTIGNQVLNGFSADQWSSYLDAAGYPKQSRLPASYAAPAPEPLVSRPAAPPPVAAPAPAPPPPVAPPPAPGGIRF